MANLPNTAGDYDVQSVCYVLFDDTGAIAQAGTIEVGLIQYIKGDRNLIYTERSYSPEELASYYVLNREMTLKPQFPVPDEVSLSPGQSVTYEGVPEGTVLTFDNQEYLIDDGSLEIEGEAEGQFEYVLTVFPYLDKTIKVTVA